MEPTGDMKQKGGILRRQRDWGERTRHGRWAGAEQRWRARGRRLSRYTTGARPARTPHLCCWTRHHGCLPCRMGLLPVEVLLAVPLSRGASAGLELLGMSWWSRVFTAAGDGREGHCPSGPCSGKQALILMAQKKDTGCWAANSKGVVSIGAFPVEKNMIEISALM